MKDVQPEPSHGSITGGRIAAIDAGSNAIRFVVAEPTGPTSWAEIESQRVAIRLGTAAFRTGELDPDLIDEAVAAFAGFRRRMNAAGAERYRAVATSAVRDSPDGRRLVERVYAESAIRLEPITGEEEARLVWRATRARIGADGRRHLLVDLGGGSTEISLVAGDRLVSSESYRLGAVRLMSQLDDTGAQDLIAVRQLLEKHEALSAIAKAAPGWGAAGMIATGGNIDALADIAGAPLDERGVRILLHRRLRDLVPTIAALSPDQRAARWGLRPDRADVILPAAMVYERVADIVGAERILVPGVGVKEGLLLDLLTEA